MIKRVTLWSSISVHDKKAIAYLTDCPCYSANAESELAAHHQQ